MLRSILFILLIFASQVSAAFTYTLEITEQELQEKISAMMPMEKKKFFVTVIISDPDVNLIKESNEIGLFANINVIAPGGIKGSGRGKIVGTLTYDAENGAFYFHNPKIISLEFDKVPEKYVPKIQQITQLAVASVMAQHPVYKFKDDNLKHKLAKATLDSVAIKNGKLLVTLSAF